jgi:CHAT domain-containing protein
MVNKTMLVEADATMPDKHFLSGRNEIPHEPDSHQKIKASALQLAAINNPAFTVRGEKNPESLDIEFRQAAFEFGHNLYKNYFTNKLSEVMPVLLHYENNAFMKLDIDESVEGLPWEALHDGKNFLSTKLCFSRVLGAQGSRRAHKQINFENIGILLVGSDSRGDLPGVTSEVQNIAAILSDTGFSRVELLDGLKANRKNLLELLKSGEFNILHYSGHSVFNSSYPYQSYLEFIKSERLFLHELDDFSNQGLELVFLNSCQSGKTGLDQTTGRELSMCRTIRESGVANVIGMLWNVSDDAAAHFASEFYGFLSGNDQLHVAEAIRQTRCKVAMERAWQDGSWLAPILYT